MNSNDLARYAAMFATGSITSDKLLEITGDSVIVSQIVALAPSIVAGNIASNTVEAARDIPVVNDVLDLADDMLGGVTDLFGF